MIYDNNVNENNFKDDTCIPDLSIIVPFLNEEESLPLLKESISKLQVLQKCYEIVLVSDGSSDGSIDFVEKWASEDFKIKLVIFSRNFGHQAAITAGLQYAQGKYVGIIDADLQDPPEVLIDLYDKARQGWDIVYGVRRHRVAKWYKEVCYHLFYRLYVWFADIPVNVDSGDFCVMNRCAVDALNRLPEKVRFVRGLRAWLGLRQCCIEYNRPDRVVGKAQYSALKLINLALQGLSSFSVTPLRLASFGGMSLCVLAFLLASFYFSRALFGGLHEQAPGFATLVVLLLFLSGLQFMLIGILGEYIGQIFLEVKSRPTYFVQRTVNICSRFKSVVASKS